MRVHNEGGIAEGSYPFWKTLFEAITANAKNGRTIELDMHAKGVNQTMIDIGVATGMHVKLGAKRSAKSTRASATQQVRHPQTGRCPPPTSPPRKSPK